MAEVSVRVMFVLNHCQSDGGREWVSKRERKQDKAVWSRPGCYYMHLRVFTELKGNTTCTGAAAQQSTRVRV